ncbi:hypothetical protein J5N97_027613 [Dioscorea zingiberensis]|uniref:Uncharacterized protein n=1 Tax=Dioscorea zingiberensis TaxID=325984 RepID=A0A9D5C561_9LILI|nr:hypothetical protein J5N97_027613 [Dioscorea zingiberensis]
MRVGRCSRAVEVIVRKLVLQLDVMQKQWVPPLVFVIQGGVGMNLLASELSDAAAKERAMFNECRELLSSTAAIQVQESSLRTHLIQLRQDFYKMK